MDFRDCRVTILGLGHFGGGLEAARWLAWEGARVTVTDLADAEVLADSLADLADTPIEAFHLGGHREEDFRDADLVVVNPAVRIGSRFVQIARDSGTLLTTEIELFMRHCPATIIGVTGSNGKSTTAALIDAVLRADGRTSWLGGNLGGSLLGKLEWIQPGDWAVLELSSFQLAWLAPDARMPPVAVVTNCSPNHLDWHRDYADYVATKQRMLLGQGRDDWAVLNTHDPEVASWKLLVRDHIRQLPALDEVPTLSIPGGHNRVNAACAAAAALAAGCDWESIRRGLAGFGGLPQRLQLIGEVQQRRFYNDSSATTPESTIEALQSLDRPTWLLAGGKDKGLDYGGLAAVIARKARGAAMFGSVREVLRGWTAAENPQFPCTAIETMSEALDWCWQRSQPGEAILLSPGCSSVDQFRNFRQRGEQFDDLVRDLSNRGDLSK